MKRGLSSITVPNFFLLLINFSILAGSGVAQTPWSDNFESYPIGQFPTGGGWNLMYNGAGTNYQLVDGTHAVSGTRALRLVGSSCWAASAYRSLVIPNNVEAEAMIYVDAIVNCGCEKFLALVGLIDPSLGTWGTGYAEIGFACDGIIYAMQQLGDRSKDVSLMAYQAKKWYRVKTVLNLDERRFNVHIDGSLLASGLKIYDTGWPKGIVVGATHGNNPTAWFDDISVRNAGSPPPAATLVSPSGLIATPTPTYTWNSVDTATHYYLWVNDSAGSEKVKKWYTASEAGCASGETTCSVAPATPIAAGAAQWWIQTYNDYGYGEWSRPLSFIVASGGAPGKASLISPTGSITTSQPAYIWHAVPYATWYQLWVDDADARGKIREWYTAAQAGCSSGVGNCSITPSTPLAAGAARWWVQTWNDAGLGPWSDPLSFAVSPGTPAKATLISPSGSIYSVNPTYTWNAVSSATWYQLWVNDSRGSGRIRTWYTAEQANCASGTGTCAVNPSVTLAAGSCQWWIQTWNNAGYGPWSDPMSFTIIPE